MNTTHRWELRAVAAFCFSLMLAACGGGDPGTGSGSSTGSSTGSSAGGDAGGSTGGDDTTPKPRIFLIKPGASATTDMTKAMAEVVPGDTIQFDCGFFDLSATLQLSHNESITIKGCGKDKTVLSFKNNTAQQEGVLIDQVNGVVIQDLTVADSAGNGFELRSVDHGTLSRVRAIWSSGGGASSANPITAVNFKDKISVPCTHPATESPDVPEHFLGIDTTSPDYTVSKLSGRYGIYPVSSENILIEDSESVGASDAGIYVGQTNNAIIRDSRSAFNVFGFEIENVNGGEYVSNVAECNTGGFLIYDIDGLRQYGDRSRMHDNIARMNNTYNFTSGGFVSNVPPGSGMITLAYDRIDIFNNEFTDNNTAGIIHASYELFPEGAGRPTEKRIDWYTEGLHIYHNKFRNNGNGLPLPTTTDLKDSNVAHLLPAVVGLKTAVACALPTNTLTCLLAGGNLTHGANVFRGGHIVWDGLLDTYAKDCPYPLGADGKPAPMDSRGKPLLTNSDPNPSCHYNAYKFDTAKAAAPRIVPDWYASCIDDDNDFGSESLKFVNFHGTKGLEAVVNTSLDPTDPTLVLQILQQLDLAALLQFPSNFDMSDHQCVARYGKNLPPLDEVVIPPFVPSGNFDPAPSAERVAQLCGAAIEDGKVNFAAAAEVNCPTLDQYHLFADAQDPTSMPNADGVPFSLNSKLFSDYAIKYRVAYLPPGTQAVYKDKSNGANATIVFPAGTVIAKTFSFKGDTAGSEKPVETRLLIKRTNSKGGARWDGFAYLWQKDSSGKRIAALVKDGATASVDWDVTDVDSTAANPHSSGHTDGYLIPNTSQCLSCHSNQNKEPGASPIGPKVRFMNGPFRAESALDTAQGKHHAVLGKNQIAYWCTHGLMMGCPSDLGVNDAQIATKIERNPIFNKLGDSGLSDPKKDLEARARAYLEVNCEHCHNEKGFAASTGLYLDTIRPVDMTYGICKHPTAAGASGSGGHTFDVVPQGADKSIMSFRLNATDAAARMPPITRSVVHVEGKDLINQWISSVLKNDEAAYPNSTACAAASAP